MSLWCPRCIAPVLQHAARCAVCGVDLHAAPEAMPDAVDGDEETAPRLAPHLEGANGPARSDLPVVLLRAAALALAALLVAGVLVGLAAAAAAAGWGEIAWPALIGVGVAALLAGLTQLERRRSVRSLRLAARGRTDESDATAIPSDLALAHLFAARFAPPIVPAEPAAHGAPRAEPFWPPLAAQPVDAVDAAWRAVAATLLDLADADVVELEPRALPTPGKPVAVLGVHLVRPLLSGDAIAARLLRPLARRGVGGSMRLCDLVAHLGLPPHQPARALLVSARDELTARGYYAANTAGRLRAALRTVLLLPLPPDPARIASARPALDALEARLDAWDERDPTLGATIRHEVCAGLIRTRARRQ